MILRDSVVEKLQFAQHRLLNNQNYNDSFEILRRDKESEDSDRLNVIAFP